MATNARPARAPEKSNKTAVAEAAKLVAAQLTVDTKGSTDKMRDASGRTVQERHEQRRGWYLAEASRQASNRAIMAKCESFYDSEQIDHEEAETLRERGQNPVVYNEVFYVVNWLIGTERRNRVDFYVVAEGDEEADSDDATTKTKLLKYLDDTNKAAFERSYAAMDQFKAGIGWLEVGLSGDKNGPPIFVGAESWRNILWDSMATRRDLSDARYFFRIKTLDLDVALAIFPDKETELRAAAQTNDTLSMFSGWTGVNQTSGGLDSFNRMDGADDFNSVNVIDIFNPRERVMLLECWSREPVRKPKSDTSMGDPVTFKMRVTIMTELDTLLEAWSPYKHDRAPFIPLWAYRNARTGLPYSPIRPLLGPQEALNHRMSKSLYEASANQYEIEKGAVDDEVMNLEELRAEWNDPAGTAVYANGALTNNKVRKVDNAGAASQQIMLAERDISTIRHMSGIDAAAQGLKSNLSSGVALKTNNDNVGLLTSELFDNQLLARQMEGEMTLSLAEQFVVQPMTVRVAGEGGSQGDRVKINEPQDDGTFKNDITARRAHFVVGEQAWKQSYAESAFESLMQVMTQLASAAPQVVVNLLDVVFEMHPNLPRKKAILERIRKVNGQGDPDGKMTPEQQQEQQQKAQMAKQQFDLQMAQLTNDVKLAKSKGAKMDADAMLVKVTALYEAAQAAAVLAASPALTPIADAVLASAGYVDEAGSPQTLGPDGTPAQAEQPMPGAPTQGAVAGAPPQAMQQAAEAQAPQLQQTDGAQAGIETPRTTDGAPPQGEQQ
jgi:hypothetical protein